MDGAAAEKEALRLWRNLPVQDRLSHSQARAFAAMIAPTLDFGPPEKRTKLIEAWLLKDIGYTETPLALNIDEPPSDRPRLTAPPWPQREGAPLIAFVISLLVMIARRPDIVSNAMLWAEDGTVWFADAYNTGIFAPLFDPHAGYLRLFPRLFFGLATLLPLDIVPIMSVLAALFVRAALPAFLFSSRFTWIDWRAKVAVAAYFLLMPNLAEVHANITNTHWYLGLYLLAVIFADPPRSIGWKIHDWAVLLVAGASGPMVLFALPCLLLRAFSQRNTPNVRLPFVAVAIALAALQVSLLLFGAGVSGGLRAPLYPDLLAFLRILGSRVFLGFLSPSRWATALSAPVIAIPIVALGLGGLVAVLIRGDWKARGLAITAPLIVIAALYTPVFNLARTSWPPLTGLDQPGFYVVTNMTWAATVVYFSAIYLPRLSSATLAVLVAVCGFLILFDFTLPSVPGTEFGPQVKKVANTPVGQPVTVPISPPGWTMTLVKH